MKFFLILIPFIGLFNGPELLGQTQTPAPIIAGNYVPSYVNERFHTSEGLFLRLSDGALLQICRLDPGENSDHVRNRGRIVKRISHDLGQSWSVFMPVYNHPDFDDRNVCGIHTGGDTLVLFFRTFDAVGNRTVSLNQIVSTDGGQTWSSPVPFPAPGNFVFGGNPVKTATGSYLLPLYSTHEWRLYFSSNGTDWSKVDGAYTQIPCSDTLCLSETALVALPNGFLAGLCRNNSAKKKNAWLIVSADNGKSWQPLDTLPLAYPVSKPWLNWDSNLQQLISCIADRRIPDYQNSSLFFFGSIPDSSKKAFSLKTTCLDSIARPRPSTYRFYGYPYGISTADQEYLFMVTESNLRKNGLENADFFQFKIKIVK